MRKVLVIAVRDYMATVRTKGFIIGLLLMPVLWSGGFLAQRLVGDQVDVRERHIAVVDRSPEGKLGGMLKAKADAHNQELLKSGQGAQAPAFDLVIVEPRPDEQDQRFELSERVRDKSLDGFIEIDAEVY